MDESKLMIVACLNSVGVNYLNVRSNGFLSHTPDGEPPAESRNRELSANQVRPDVRLLRIVMSLPELTQMQSV